MSNEDITLSVRKLLEGCGISDTLPTETACLQAFRAPQSALFAIQTATLSKFMRVLKSKAVSDKAKQNIEESFMKLVTKVSKGKVAEERRKEVHYFPSLVRSHDGNGRRR